MGKPQQQSTSAGRQKSIESFRNLPKLTIPSQQQPTDTSPPTVYFDADDASPLTSIYFDAYDSFYTGSPESPIPNNAWYTAIEPEHDDEHPWDALNSSKETSSTGSTPVPARPTVVIPATSRGPSRGISQANTSCGRPPLGVQAQAEAASVPRSGVKKALLVGINYDKYGKEDMRLTRSVADARRFEDTLMKQGYASENIRVVTDEDPKSQTFPSCTYLVESMDWLVHDASKGDELFFAFSGHCEPNKMGKPEPHLVAADLMAIPRSTFHDHLVAKVPSGAELTIVLDCCNAAGMVELKYCVGKMDYEREVKSTVGSATPTGSGKPVQAIGSIPLAGSLCGLPATGQMEPPRMMPAAFRSIASGAPSNSPPRSRGIVAGKPLQPVVTLGQAPAPGMMSSMMGRMAAAGPPSLAKASAGTSVRVGRQLVVEGRPVRYFEESKKECVASAGKVVVFAGAGLRQKSYEPTGDAKNSILTDAICSVFDKCIDAASNVTWRDVWNSVVGAIDKENSLRSERDKLKDQTKLRTNTRWQCAEMWMSQEEALKSSSPVLDQRVFWA